MTECVAHRFHSPRPQTLALHHVFPASLGGADDGETVALCPTGHDNVHELLKAYRDRGQTPPWELRRQYGPGERHLAAEGWRLYREAIGARG
jgi:5-methylcytosine-specific restriction endonuclease McrA